MKFLPALAISVIAAAPAVTVAIAEETRQLGAHEHGVGQLDIAFEGSQIAMALHAPGADIVGFEYSAKTAEDRAAVNKAVAILARPLDLFVMPDAAACRVVQASASLESEHGAHEDHDAHADHEHAEVGHDEHAHEDHAEDAHEEHAHEDATNEAGHAEFHAEYALVCANPSAVTDITFAYFQMFPNAVEVDVQVISDAGATSFEVERDAPVLDLRSLF